MAGRIVSEHSTLYTTKPCPVGEGHRLWCVWDMYHPDAAARFVGSMEDCGLVADALNARNEKGGFENG